MSKKRKSVECSNVERTTEDSAIILQQTEYAKREKIASFSETTLQDLPIEMLQFILVKAVAMEVMGMKLAKCTWKEKADLVINRLQTVCLQWDNILTASFFRNELYRTLDGTAQNKIRLEILHQLPIPFHVFDAAATKNEIFLHGWGQDKFINVYERSNVCRGLKDVIPLPDSLKPLSMAACSVSNCLYVYDYKPKGCSIKRIAKRVGQPVVIETWITDMQFSSSLLSVSANGDLAIVVVMPGKPDTTAVQLYDVGGFLQRSISMLPYVGGFGRTQTILQRPNGNLVLVRFVNGQSGLQTLQLTEIDLRGIIVRQYQSGLSQAVDAHFADSYGRIFIVDKRGKIEVVDSELNPLDFDDRQTNAEWFGYLQIASTNGDSNEIVRIYNILTENRAVFNTIRFTEK